MQLAPVHHLVGEPMQLAGLEGPAEDGPVRRTRVHAAGDIQEALAGQTLQLPPQLIGAVEQGYVGGVLPVGQPDDAGESVGGAILVKHIEALEAEHPEASAGEMEQCRTAHPAQTEDDDIVRGQKLTFRILPSVPTNQPASGVANATAQ